jgi:hypothetical protein
VSIAATVVKAAIVVSIAATVVKAATVVSIAATVATVAVVIAAIPVAIANQETFSSLPRVSTFLSRDGERGANHPSVYTIA